jgi:hypothetical protein
MPTLIRIGHKRMFGLFRQNLSGSITPSGLLVPTLLAPPVPIGELTPMLALYPQLNSAFAEVTYAAKPPSGRVVLATDADAASFGVLQGRWSMLNGSGIADSDPTAPAFGPTVYDRPWFQGNDTGNGPGQMTIRPASAIPANGYAEFYQCNIIKIPDTYGDGMCELATANAIAKMWGFWSKVDQNNPFYSLVRGLDSPVQVGATTNRRTSRIRMDYATQTGTATPQDPERAVDDYPGGSASNQTLTIGPWFRIELYAKVNTIQGTISSPGPGNFDGELRWWLTNMSTNPNGTPVQVGHHTNFKVRTQYKPRGWQQWLYDPTYGGNPGDPITRTQHIFHAYCFQAWGLPL